MKRSVAFLSVCAAASLATAAEVVSIDKGRELFSSSQLGSNGKSCNSCHPDGNGLSKAAGYEETGLVEIINRCISGPLQGKELDPNSVEMKSLLMYIKHLAPIAQQ